MVPKLGITGFAGIADSECQTPPARQGASLSRCAARSELKWRVDPLHFLPGSVIGCPGILNAARAGKVTIANAVGNGVADDKLLYTYMPDLIRYYMSEEPLLPSVESYRLDDPEVLDWVLAGSTSSCSSPWTVLAAAALSSGRMLTSAPWLRCVTR